MVVPRRTEWNVRRIARWRATYAAPPRTYGGTLWSVAAHAAVVAGWALGVPSSNAPTLSELISRVYYMPPPNRDAGSSAVAERILYVSAVPPASVIPNGDFPAPRGIVSDLHVVTGTMPPQPTDGNRIAPTPIAAESVYTFIEVDSVAVRMPESVAPAYPPALLAKRVEGSVLAQYVVDTTGFPDPATFLVLSATDTAFVSAVRAALPLMRFVPARMGERKVPQLVEQEFKFRVQPTPPGRGGGLGADSGTAVSATAAAFGLRATSR
jgi:protein TonB